MTFAHIFVDRRPSFSYLCCHTSTTNKQDSTELSSSVNNKMQHFSNTSTRRQKIFIFECKALSNKTGSQISACPTRQAPRSQPVQQDRLPDLSLSNKTGSQISACPTRQAPRSQIFQHAQTIPTSCRAIEFGKMINKRHIQGQPPKINVLEKRSPCPTVQPTATKSAMMTY